jgi:hypothetical protein
MASVKVDGDDLTCESIQSSLTLWGGDSPATWELASQVQGPILPHRATSRDGQCGREGRAVEVRAAHIRPIQPRHRGPIRQQNHSGAPLPGGPFRLVAPLRLTQAGCVLTQPDAPSPGARSAVGGGRAGRCQTNAVVPETTRPHRHAPGT